MRRVWALALLAGWSAPAQILPEEISRRAEAMAAKLSECRRDFHMHPELSNHEERTARVIAERLRALGFTDIRTGVARHGIVATLVGAKPGPVVAWRTDMDALPIDESTFPVDYRSKTPGVKHACGHDAHMAVALGLAELLAGMQSQLGGTVQFVFQPAEEGAKDAPEWGAKLMVKEGALDNPRPQAIFAFHVNPMIEAGQIGYSPGPGSAASDTIRIRILGKRAHGAYPFQGIDAVAVASQCISAIQAIHSRRIPTQSPSVITIGTIQGGDRRNIIAESVELGGTVRTFEAGTRDTIERMLGETLEGCTAAQGAKFELNYRRGYPAMNNNAALVEAALPALRKLLGESKVVALKPPMSAEDFSYFQEQIPGVMFSLGVRNEARGITAGVHTANFDLDESALVTGVKVAATLVLDVLGRKQ
ncbi:MAG: M20 family metallopeptidase [Bryobacter sp.]|nr:M20 family metallopeptidase [Bryobacter sp.]